ncbi:MAG TPA: hypothetical protein VGD14_09390 [bacterium]
MKDQFHEKPDKQPVFQFHAHSNYFTPPKPVWISPPVHEPFLFSSPGAFHLYPVQNFFMGVVR